jgi:hypothetical protein
MANIGIPELLNDPDFCDPFHFVRRTENVDPTTGRSAFTSQTFCGYGSIQPLSGQALRMMPQLANSEGTIEIWSSTPLQTITSTLKADIVLWNGNQYTVTAIPGNWSNYGGGFCRYVGTLHDLETNGSGQQ